MKHAVALVGVLLLGAAAGANAQEANSGFDLGTTISAEGLYSQQMASPPRSGGDPNAAFRAIVYPTWKVNSNWTLSGAVEAYSYPYFFEDISSNEDGTTVQILHADVSYSRFWGDRSIVIRAGQLQSAFGSFLLRYDDAVNPLIDMPQSYGYYLKGVNTLSLAGGEVDASLGKFDLRGQLTNSSPTNPRSLLDTDQYLNWTLGGGYTILQGFRLGASAYRGPYLDPQFAFYFPGEKDPRDLPATGVGVDVEWGRGHWNINGEWQRFQMDYTMIPDFTEQAGYGEIRFVLGPRWFVASRIGYIQPSAGSEWQSYETAVGFRPGTHELVKLEYEIHQGPAISGTQQNVLAIQFVTSFHPLSFASR